MLGERVTQVRGQATADFSFAAIRHLLIDMDGVLYRGAQPLPAASAFIAFLRQRSVSFRLVTNNATLTPEQYVAKLRDMRIEATPEEIFTSSLATARYLKAAGQAGKRAFVIGEEGIRQALFDVGMNIVDENPEWVVVGLDRGLTYARLAAAALALESGAHFLGTNPDTSFPDERGLVPGAGAILAALTATTGMQPTVIGKPEPLMFEQALQDLGGNYQDTVMLGDRLDTDILGAQRVRLATILVLTGVSSRADVQSTGIHPSAIVQDLVALMQEWDADS